MARWQDKESASIQASIRISVDLFDAYVTGSVIHLDLHAPMRESYLWRPTDKLILLVEELEFHIFLFQMATHVSFWAK